MNNNAGITEDQLRQLRRLIQDGEILIGGQSVLFWAAYYGIENAEKVTTRDVDMIGTERSVQKIAKTMGGKIFRPPRMGFASKLIAEIRIYNKNNEFVGIDILRSPAGLTAQEVAKRAVKVSVDGNDFLVMHPIHCVISKLYNYCKISDKHSDTGYRQAALSLKTAKAYLADIVDRHKDDEATVVIEEIAKLARRPLGKLARKHGLGFESILDKDMLDNINNESFKTKRLPRLLAEIENTAMTPG